MVALQRQQSSHEGDDFKVEVTNLDAALRASGGCGCFQITRHIIFFFISLPFASQNLFMVFGGHEPPWKCTANSSVCKVQGKIGKDSPFYNTRCSMKRQDWEYMETRKWSIVTEYDLVCSKEYLGHVAGSAYFIGAIPGAIFCGWAANKFGRKKILLPTLFGGFATAVVAGVTKGIWLFIALRFINGFCFSGLVTAMVVIACEIVGPNYRPLSGVLLWNYFAVGLLFFGCKAYLLHNWRKLQLVTVLPYLFVFWLLRYLPESMRWLWVNGRSEESQQIFHQIAKENNKSPVSLKGVILKETRFRTGRKSLSFIFHSRDLLFQTAVHGYTWFVQGLLYYAFFLVSDNLSGHMLRDFLLTSFMEIPANFLSIYCSRRYGRKRTFILSAFMSFLAGSSIAILTMRDTEAIRYVRLTLGLIGKLFITNGVNALYIWSQELYPTVIRSQVMGFFLALRPLGGAAAPWFTSWMMNFHVSLPFALLSVLTVFEILLCFPLDETKDREMMDDFEDDNQLCKEIASLPLRREEKESFLERETVL